ncbi:20349_t:CDS:2 [Funneliformis geosporum]|nr:20349_t:CDS:2 [Funneliformis geosporum]
MEEIMQQFISDLTQDNISNEIIINLFVNYGIIDSLDDLNNEDKKLKILDIDNCDDSIHDNDSSCDDNSCNDDKSNDIYDNDIYNKSDNKLSDIKY